MHSKRILILSAAAPFDIQGTNGRPNSTGRRITFLDLETPNLKTGEAGYLVREETLSAAEGAKIPASSEVFLAEGVFNIRPMEKWVDGPGGKRQRVDYVGEAITGVDNLQPVYALFDDAPAKVAA